ncbi:class I SAM-dependent DNA methyltransferase [Streptomyces gobiensis]|uniref:class I SAM-dependent DNA methyltransferase n=1 Tax=Streptomyces gobiensis TaxID=2875706 RepID=UPI001E381B94|nr:class I SAM-dependent DNA methyltransferase [Streptomyces gobiensis]UGY90769.1 class I SAM-dependent DNA methyltransferase [Streptomyces gobiensis]
MSYDSLVNHGDYLSAHYLAEVLPKDLKATGGLLSRWTATETERKRAYEKAVAEVERAGEDPKTVPEPDRTPRQGLRSLRTPYFADRAAFAQVAEERAEDPAAPLPSDWVERRARLDAAILGALGYGSELGQPQEHTLTVHHADRAHEVRVAHAEPGITAVSCGWTAQPDAALDPDSAGALLHPVPLEGGAEIADAKAMAAFLFAAEEPPRYVLLLCGGVIVLADRLTWGEGRYLAVSLDVALDRMDDSRAGELDTIAALFSADALRVPEEGGTAPLADLAEKSAKHAVGVSTELREGVRTSVELIAGEVLARLREQGARLEEIDEPKLLAKQLTRESLRYVYRILFLLYAEARPELGILPSDYPEYGDGYGLQRLGELALRDLVGDQSRSGFHFYESLDLLCRMVERGHRPYGTEEEDREAEAADRATRESEAEAARLLAEGQITEAEHAARLREAERTRRAARSADTGLRFEPLRSELFAAKSIELIGPRCAEFYDTRLRNEVLHQVLRRLMLTKGKRGQRGGFISYAQLGINQLGAVYEGLMSYTGFIADQDLYEVAKDGDPSGGSWMVPVKRAGQYPDEVFVRRRNEETGAEEPIRYERGSFVYRLGRDRQTSASYYTPESLTQVTVELALRERLTPDTPARELLEWTICEPALGSGAFLNEAINQVAAEYLRRRERELGARIDPEERQHELQKAKAYIALHNAYGVDLNATAVELAEVSLWLNTMHPGMKAPWYGLHLRRGNSLIGAGRRVYEADALAGGAWLRKKDALAPTELPFRQGAFPDGAVHHFLLPASGWGAVAGEREARDLAPEETAALKAWRRGIQKAPSAKRKRGERRGSQLDRLQGVARRAEFLWGLVAQRLQLSERDISRRVDVWGADWLDHPGTAVDKNKVLDDLLAVGAPYWRLKTLMDAWCALWFWPLDAVGLVDGSAPEYEEDEDAAPEPVNRPGPADQLAEQSALFDDGAGEQLGLPTPKVKPQRKTGTRKAQIVDIRRSVIPLKDLDDWIDFAEAVLGGSDVPEDSLIERFTTLEALSDYEDQLPGLMGMDSALKLHERFPWLAVVEDIAGANEGGKQTEGGLGFFHWELQFAHVFAGEGGGFDLQVGNPPWVRPRWEEDTVLAERDPWFKLAEKPSVAEFRERKGEVLADAGALYYFLGELVVNAGLVELLSSPVAYPVLRGTQPDLYRAFMCRVWGNLGPEAVAGLVHPDTHLGGIKTGRIRAAVYPRLRLHVGFVNERNWAFEAAHTIEFGVHIYGVPRPDIRFANLSRLHGVDPVIASLDHDGHGEVPGMRHEGRWDLRPHRARVIEVDVVQLAEWQALTGDTGVAPSEAALLQPVTTAEQGAITALSTVETRLGERKPQITSGYHEKMGKENGYIGWRSSQPRTLGGLVLQGPHFGLGTPISKQPNVPCQGNHDWTSFDLTDLPPDIVPRGNYVRPESCSPDRFRLAQDRWLDYARSESDWEPSDEDWERRAEFLSEEELRLAEEAQQELLHRRMWLTRPYTEFYRLAWRRMVAFNTERSLFAALVPPGPAHVDGVYSMALRDNRETSLNAGFWASLPMDYLVRIAGRSNLLVAEAKKMPAADPQHPLSGPLLLRSLRLNCLSDAYASLWAELYESHWPGYEEWAVDWPELAPLAGYLKPTWEYGTPLRTEYERRAALVELDALVAVWLGLSADQLAAIYKSRYPILSDRESRMWFDTKGRKLAEDPRAYGYGQTKQDFADFLAFQKGERDTPPSGYTADFYKADREREMREAHAVFSARLKRAVDRGERVPSQRERG